MARPLRIEFAGGFYDTQTFLFDRMVLAQMRNCRIHASTEQIAKALEGR